MRLRARRGNVGAMGDLEGKRAWVSGAAQGIGQAIAVRLAAGGAKVVLTDVNGDGAVAAAEQIGGDAYGEQVDVTDAAVDRSAASARRPSASAASTSSSTTPASRSASRWSSTRPTRSG